MIAMRIGPAVPIISARELMIQDWEYLDEQIDDLYAHVRDCREVYWQCETCQRAARIHREAMVVWR